MSGVIGALVGDSIDEADGAVGRRDLVTILRLVIPSLAAKSAVINFTEWRRSFCDTLDSNLKYVILIIGLILVIIMMMFLVLVGMKCSYDIPPAAVEQYYFVIVDAILRTVEEPTKRNQFSKFRFFLRGDGHATYGTSCLVPCPLRVIHVQTNYRKKVSDYHTTCTYKK